jgi:hypothetical protein
VASALLCLAATAALAAGPSPLPALKSVAVGVDTTSLPASEQAALIPILPAARQMDALYIQKVWPGSRTLTRGRQSDQTSAARAELDALNSFKGSGDGAPFIDAVPSQQPMGDDYPSGIAKHEVDNWWHVNQGEAQ